MILLSLFLSYSACWPAPPTLSWSHVHGSRAQRERADYLAAFHLFCRSGLTAWFFFFSAGDGDLSVGWVPAVFSHACTHACTTRRYMAGVSSNLPTRFDPSREAGMSRAKDGGEDA